METSTEMIEDKIGEIIQKMGAKKTEPEEYQRKDLNDKTSVGGPTSK